jgi:uncharacterized protein
VVIMKPDLPLSWFDYCLIPDHDNPPDYPHVLVTLGAITAVTGGGAHAAEQGLILIGGPSRHCRWDNDNILSQIRTILDRNPQITWYITDSQRTPPATRAALKMLKYTNGKFISHKDTDRNWVVGRLADSGSAWVSADSLSMIYESLTSGTATGILSVPANAESKIKCCIRALKDRGMITTFADWDHGTPLITPAELLNEADRCARFLLEHLTR